MKNVLTKADFGISYRYKDYTVSEIIFPSMWHSMQYNTVALLLTIVIGIPAGVFVRALAGHVDRPCDRQRAAVSQLAADAGDRAVHAALPGVEDGNAAGERLA